MSCKHRPYDDVHCIFCEEELKYRTESKKIREEFERRQHDFQEKDETFEQFHFRLFEEKPEYTERSEYDKVRDVKRWINTLKGRLQRMYKRYGTDEY